MNQNLPALEAIRRRYSCRAFGSRCPSREALQAVSAAAAASPSAMNRQPWRIIAVTNQALLAEMDAEGMQQLAAQPDTSAYARMMSRGGKLFYGAPVMLFLAVPRQEPEGPPLLDCGIVTQSIAIAAASLGIDSLICGLAQLSFAGERGPEFRQRLGLRAEETFGIAVLLGYAAAPGGSPHAPDLDKISWVE